MQKIIIVDDHPIFRMGMSELLNQEEDFTVCAMAEDIAGAREALKEWQPDRGNGVKSLLNLLP